MIKKIYLMIIISVVIFPVFAKGLPEKFNNFKTRYNSIEQKENSTTGKIDIIFASFWANPTNSSIFFDDSIEVKRTQNDIMQIIINRINAQNYSGNIIFHPNIQLNQSYYDQLDVLFDSSIYDSSVILPDMFLLSNTKLVEYYYKGYLEKIYAKDMNKANIDITNLRNSVRGLGTINKHIYGIPLGYDMLVWYINMETFRKAGLVDKNNNPILPSNMEELVVHATQFKEKTGFPYLGIDLLGSDGIRTLMTLWWQFGENIVDIKSNEPLNVTLDTLGVRLVSQEFVNLFIDGLAKGIESSIQLQSQFTNDKLGVVITSVSARERFETIFTNRFNREVDALKKRVQEIKESDDLEAQKEVIVIPESKEYVHCVPFPILYHEEKDIIVWGSNNLFAIRKGLRDSTPIKYKVVMDIFKEIDRYDYEWEQHTLLSARYDTSYAYMKNNTINANNKSLKMSIDQAYKNKVIIRDIPPIQSHIELLTNLRSMLRDMILNNIPVENMINQTQATLVDLLVKQNTLLE